MAITYHAGRRIQGLERTGSTATEISGFTISGTSGKVSESTGTLSFTINSSSQSTLAVKALPANAGSSYVLRYKLTVTTDDIAFPSGQSGNILYGTTSATSGVAEDPPLSSYTIYVKHALHADVAANYSIDGSSRTNDWGNGVSNGSGARTKYVEVINNAGSMTTRYTDSSDYTGGVVTPAWSVASGAQSGAKGNIFFNFFTNTISSGSIVGTVSDVKLYNNVTSVTPATWTRDKYPAWYEQTTRDNSVGMNQSSSRDFIVGHQNNTGSSKDVTSAIFRLAKVGDGGNGTVTARIYDSSLVLKHTSTNSIAVSSLTTSFVDTTFNFTDATCENTWVVCLYTTGNSSGDNFVLCGVDIVTGDTERVINGQSSFSTYNDRLVTITINGDN